MPKHRIIKKGGKFGRLEVLEYKCKELYLGSNAKMYRCKCDCGNIVTRPGKRLGKNIISCGCYKTNTSGVMGVQIKKDGMYQAGITIKGKYYHLGRFKTLAEAAQVRKKAEERYKPKENDHDKIY